MLLYFYARILFVSFFHILFFTFFPSIPPLHFCLTQPLSPPITRRLRFEELQKEKSRGKKIKVSKFAMAGGAGVAVLAGSTLALGIGSLILTAANAPVAEALGPLDAFLPGDCCGCECCDGLDGCIDCCEGCMVCGF